MTPFANSPGTLHENLEQREAIQASQDMCKCHEVGTQLPTQDSRFPAIIHLGDD
jgi:hypothetical protein